MGETLFHRLLDDEGFGSEGLYVNVSSGRRLGSTHPLLLPLVSCSMVVAVLVGGALVFRQLEQLAEREEAEAFLALQKELREKFETMQEEHLELFHRYISLSEKYMSTRSTAPDDDNLNWTFMGSLYFCMTVITTIGYGSYTPITKGGKCFLMIYALVGIPCFIVMLTIVSEAVLRPIKKFAKHMMFHMVDRGYMTSFSWTPSTIVIVILALFTASFVLAWSCFFAVFNDWSYLDAIYFGVVTVTTIGFGDFAPDTGEASWADHCLYMFYLIFGLMSMGTLVAAIQNKTVEHTEKVDVRMRKQPRTGCASTPVAMREMRPTFGPMHGSSQRAMGSLQASLQDTRFNLGDSLNVTPASAAGSECNADYDDDGDLELPLLCEVSEDTSHERLLRAGLEKRAAPGSGRWWPPNPTKGSRF